MGVISDTWSRLTGKQPNQLDQYVRRLIGNAALYPDQNDEAHLNTYLSNNDVFTVINKKNEPAGDVPIYQYDKNNNIVEGGKMLALLNKPNPYQRRPEFIRAGLCYYDIFGENFTAAQELEFGANKGMPSRIDQLPPKFITVNPGTTFNPVLSYSFYPLQQSGQPDYTPEQVYHWKSFNPDYDSAGGHLRGMSKLKPLFKSAVGSTEAYNSLVKAFQNMGAWGLLTLLDQDGKALDLNKAQKSEVKSKFRRDSKTGEITIVSNTAHWEKIGLTVVELEILKAIGIYKGNLCDAYNVPSQLLAGSQDRTYNNYKEAEQALWRNAIMPNLNGYLQGLSEFLAPKCKEEGTVLKADYSEVACLQTNKVEMIQWMVAAQAFSRNEIREAVGFEMLNVDGMDDILISAGLMPISEAGTINPQTVEDNLKRLKIGDYRA